jgi:hypothetical protein
MKQILVTIFSLAYMVATAQICFTYDAAGNRINRVSCAIIMSPEEKQLFNDLMAQQNLDIRSETEEVDLADIIVYPNPTAGAFRLLEQHKLVGAKISVFANDGKMIENVSVTTDDIDLSHLPAGHYFMTLQLQSQKKTTKLIISK